MSLLLVLPQGFERHLYAGFYYFKDFKHFVREAYYKEIWKLNDVWLQYSEWKFNKNDSSYLSYRVENRYQFKSEKFYHNVYY